MARSSYIYLALSPEGRPLCTCTVKYEFRIWLDNLSEHEQGLVTLWRCADSLRGVEGQSGNRLTRLTLADFDL